MEEKLEVKDCIIETYSTHLFSVVTMRRVVTLILSNNTRQKIDYIMSTYDTLETIKETYKDELITILNKIYTEHNKLIILGLNYPKYELLKHRKRGLICALIGFGDPYRIIKSYRITNFTEEVYLDLDSCNIDEIILTKPTHLNMISGNVKITGIEYTKKITDTNIAAISHNIEKRADKTLILKHVEWIDINYKKVDGIEKITFENTCTIKDIPKCIFKHIQTLKEVRLCKSIETIDGQPLWDLLKGEGNSDGQSKGQCESYYYIEVKVGDEVRRIKITFD